MFICMCVIYYKELIHMIYYGALEVTQSTVWKLEKQESQ
jgi:hypothetical protein